MHKSHDEQTLKILNKDKISHGAEVNHVRIWGKKKKKRKPSAILPLPLFKSLMFRITDLLHSLWISCIHFLTLSSPWIFFFCINFEVL